MKGTALPALAITCLLAGCSRPAYDCAQPATQELARRNYASRLDGFVDQSLYGVVRAMMRDAQVQRSAEAASRFDALDSKSIDPRQVALVNVRSIRQLTDRSSGTSYDCRATVQLRMPPTDLALEPMDQELIRQHGIAYDGNMLTHEILFSSSLDEQGEPSVNVKIPTEAGGLLGMLIPRLENWESLLQEPAAR